MSIQLQRFFPGSEDVKEKIAEIKHNIFYSFKFHIK